MKKLLEKAETEKSELPAMEKKFKEFEKTVQAFASKEIGVEQARESVEEFLTLIRKPRPASNVG